MNYPTLSGGASCGCLLILRPTFRLAEQFMEVIRSNYPALASFLADHLKGLIIYTEKEGVLLTNDCQVLGNKVRLGPINSLKKSELFLRLSSTREVFFEDHQNFMVGDYKFDGKGIMIRYV